MSWEYFENRRKADREQSGQTDGTPASADRMANLCALTFTTPAGRELLDLLRAEVIERRVAREVTEASLRFVEAQRQLVLQLEHMRDAGLDAMAKKNKPAA